jgi:hypothetical protein
LDNGLRVQVDWRIKCFHAGQKILDWRLVQVLGYVRVANIRLAIDQCPFETKLRDGALQLAAKRHAS